MNALTTHADHSAGLPHLTVVVVVLAALAAYVTAAARLRRRGDAWPWQRDASWTAGVLALLYAVLGKPPLGPFTAHMAQHLLVGMVAPLLLIWARPVTLALRTTAARRSRRALLAVAHSRAAAVLTFPPFTALLDVGALWLLYRTPLLAAIDDEPWVYAVVHAHLLAAGLLFTFAICQLEPQRHRWSLAWRGTTLLVASAAHATLAKSLYGMPPPGTGLTRADLRAGAELMYYGGDLVELGLAATLAATWYARAGRRPRRRPDGRPAKIRPSLGSGQRDDRRRRASRRTSRPVPTAASIHGPPTITRSSG